MGALSRSGVGLSALELAGLEDAVPGMRGSAGARHNDSATCNRLVNNGRFLILPGVHVKGLASKILALSARQVPADWEKQYGCRPVLLETLVDVTRFRGTCYRAANWIRVGQTRGRGRMDREHKRHGQAIKDIYVYPLVRDARQRLCSNPVPTYGHAPHTELVDAHSLFARLVWHQVRPRERSATDARHRMASPHGSNARPATAGSCCTWGAARARRLRTLPCSTRSRRP